MNAADDVLVVDDNADMVEIIRLVLGEAGYVVRGASNGQEALAAVASRKPALVLLDMRMPIMDGWQCARELRARYGRSVPIVVLTAAEHAHSRGRDVGADDVLPKPFEVRQLLQIVRRYLPEPRPELGAR